MTEIHQLPIPDLLWLILGALLIGMEKAGIKGLSMASVSIYALALGGKASSGLLLLLFMLADLFAVRYYYRTVQPDILRRLLPATIIGIVGGAALGKVIDDSLFKDIIAVIILTCLALMIRPVRSDAAAKHPMLARVVGLITGFSTMIANVSSPILAVYLLALRLPKDAFIGTIVWFFFIVNFIKLPFHIWSWHTIQLSTLGWALSAIPALGLGFFTGLWIVRRIDERTFRRLIVGVTIVAALKLLLS